MNDPINDLIEAVYEWGNEKTTKLANAANAENQALQERAEKAEAAWLDFVTKRPAIYNNPSEFYQEMLQVELRHDDHPGPHGHPDVPCLGGVLSPTQETDPE